CHEIVSNLLQIGLPCVRRYRVSGGYQASLGRCALSLDDDSPLGAPGNGTVYRPREACTIATTIPSPTRRSPGLITLRLGIGGLTSVSESHARCVCSTGSSTSFDLARRMPGCSCAISTLWISPA